MSIVDLPGIGWLGFFMCLGASQGFISLHDIKLQVCRLMEWLQVPVICLGLGSSSHGVKRESGTGKSVVCLDLGEFFSWQEQRHKEGERKLTSL